MNRLPLLKPRSRFPVAKTVALAALIGFNVLSSHSYAQSKPFVSKVWVADNGDGTYKNPVLNADYSDPDAIRVGEDYYLVASSFDAVPGLPILHSKDLVNWTIIGHAMPRQTPLDHFSKTQHGNGAWAPAIRYNKGEFYIYYPDPDFGIYVTKAKQITGPWSEPVLIEAGKGLIDPCPLWDDNGDVYLVHGFAGSRAGIKTVLAVKKLNAQGTAVTDAGVIVFDGHEQDPTTEGPKFYKRNGYYYIFAPAGGVTGGWQLVLRSKNVYGPYERKVVMDQGKSPINGPHQGAWVNTVTGEDWFLHFQDKEAYARVVHLQPMKWVNDWPIIGIDPDGDGKGEPVVTYKKPNTGKKYPITTPADSDEFNDVKLGLQWQWQANPRATWSFMNPTKGTLRLYTHKVPDSAVSLWDVPNVLLQKTPADEFTATAKLSFFPHPKLEEKVGLVVMGLDYTSIGLKSKKDGVYLVHGLCKGAENGKPEIEKELVKVDASVIYLRCQFTAGAKCQLYYSLDNINYQKAGDTFIAKPGKWIGAKMGFFATRTTEINDAGFADIDWFRVEK